MNPGRIISSSWLACRETRHGRMLYNPRDFFIGRSLERYGQWAWPELAFLLPRLKKGDCVVDAGAYIGTHTLSFARTVGAAGVVLAFEPRTDPFAILRCNVLLNELGQVHCARVAVAKLAGVAEFPWIPPYAEVNHGGIARRDPDAPIVGVTEVCPSASIDSYDLHECALIKGDVEGDEVRLLAGAQRTIERCSPELFLEVPTDPDKASALLATLRALNYDAWWHLAPLFSSDNFEHSLDDIFPGFDPQVNVFALHRHSAPRTPIPEALPRVLHARETWKDAWARVNGQEPGR